MSKHDILVQQMIDLYAGREMVRVFNLTDAVAARAMLEGCRCNWDYILGIHKSGDYPQRPDINSPYDTPGLQNWLRLTMDPGFSHQDVYPPVAANFLDALILQLKDANDLVSGRYIDNALRILYPRSFMALLLAPNELRRDVAALTHSWSDIAEGGQQRGEELEFLHRFCQAKLSEYISTNFYVIISIATNTPIYTPNAA